MSYIFCNFAAGNNYIINKWVRFFVMKQAVKSTTIKTKL